MEKLNKFLDKLSISKIPKDVLARRGMIMFCIGVAMIAIGMAYR